MRADAPARRSHSRRSAPARCGSRWGWFSSCACLLSSCSRRCGLAQTFPALTGRVVDAANLLKPEQRARARGEAEGARGQDHRPGGGRDGAVARGHRRSRTTPTACSGTGSSGRPARTTASCSSSRRSERKVRIEVGYGLEGALTDALSKVIITTAMAPRFQQDDFAGGLDAGVDAMLVDPDRRRGGMAAAGRGPRRIRARRSTRSCRPDLLRHPVRRSRGSCGAAAGPAVPPAPRAAAGSWSRRRLGRRLVAEVEAGPAAAAAAASRAAAARPAAAAPRGAGSMSVPV